MVNLFKKFGLVTIASVVILIFVGGIVRATGSGMGCPDWPKCFGMWVPPTNISELPINYQKIFGAKLKGEVIFNPVKTWIEYVNRLLGALIGLFIFLTFIFSYFSFKKTFPKLVILSFIAFVLVVFEGWLGSKVVSSELHPLLITLHMLVSIIILAILIYIILEANKLNSITKITYDLPGVSFLMLLAMAFIIAQIVFGTQIREAIDLAQKQLGDSNRDEWINGVKGKVYFHGLFSLVILLLTVFIQSKIKTKYRNTDLCKWSNYMLLTVVLSVLTGSILGFLKLPAIIQPFHLVFSVIIISLQFVVYFKIKPTSIS